MFSLVSVCLCVCLCAHGCWVFHTQYINANCSNTIKGREFKFDNHVHRDTPDMTPRKIFEKKAWPGSHDCLNFWALNTNCSNTVKDTDFKFHKHVPRSSPVMTPEKNSKRGRGQGHVNPHSCKFTWRIYALSESLLINTLF